MSTNVSLNLPKWKEDPYYQKTQDLSYSMGSDILKGKLPDFYGSLGKTGSDEFKNMLALVNANTATAVNENLVRRNITRGGVGMASAAKAAADSTTSLSWADYQKAASEKQGLLTTGLNTVSGVRSSALDMTGQQNQFGMQGAQLQLNADQFNAQMEQKQAEADAAKKAQKNQMWSSILSSAIGAAGTIGGMMIGGPAGAAAGGALGSAAGSYATTGKLQASDEFNFPWSRG